MKKITIILAALAMLGLSSCDNILDKTPKDTMAPENYFRNETDLRLFSDEFYLKILDKSPFDQQSDHYINNNLSNELHGGNFRVVPSTGGGWSWGVLRKINTMLGHIDNCSDEAASSSSPDSARTAPAACCIPAFRCCSCISAPICR